MNKPIGDIGREFRESELQFAAQPSLERRRLRAYIVMLLMDFVAILGGFALAGLLYHNVLFEWRAMMQAQLLLPIFYTIAFYNRTYCARALTDWRFAVGKILVALAIAAVLLNFVAFYLKSNTAFSRATFTLGLIFSVLIIAGFRRALASMVARLWQGKVQNGLVLQDGGPDFTFPGAMQISASAAGINPDLQEPHMLNRLGHLLRNQDKVVISCPDQRRLQWAYLLKSAGVHGEVVSDTAYELGALDVVRYDDCGQSTLVVSAGPLGMRERIIKRAFDLAVAVGALILLLPLIIIITLAIKLGDGGKVFFIQRRLGHGNRFFEMIKFRTMDEEAEDKNGDHSTNKADKRVTPVGRILRATSLDELPQLWNVLRGEMSIVGPRPHALGSRANQKLFWEVDSEYWRRHSLKPGLTGLAQVRGHRGATENEKHLTDRLDSDLEYIAGWSLWRDVTITLRTLSVVIHERAY
jgi:exopolysaccharide biosynthesis polyprenyl glycosylphosphotransferase